MANPFSISIRLDLETYQWLEKAAIAHRTQRAVLIRMAVEEFRMRHDPDMKEKLLKTFFSKSRADMPEEEYNLVAEWLKELGTGIGDVGNPVYIELSERYS